MVNLNGNTTISLTTITNNTSSNGNGGGISSASSLNACILTISQSIIESNDAQEGGGLFFDYQTNPAELSYLVLIESSSIQDNKAAVLGGGVFYQGYSP